MTARIITYVGDEPVEEICANCNVKLKIDTEFCFNGCDNDEEQ